MRKTALASVALPAALCGGLRGADNEKQLALGVTGYRHSEYAGAGHEACFKAFAGPGFMERFFRRTKK